MGSIEPEPVTEPIAVIGLACKFGGEARSPEEFWKMIVEGRNAWSEVPLSRFNLEGFYHPDPNKLDAVCMPKSKTSTSRLLVISMNWIDARKRRLFSTRRCCPFRRALFQFLLGTCSGEFTLRKLLWGKLIVAYRHLIPKFACNLSLYTRHWKMVSFRAVQIG